LKLTIEWSAMMFLGAILIGLPLMASLLFINIGLGVITRTAPALNIFAVGFPAMILAGIVLLSLSMTSIGYRIQWLWQESFEIIGQALGIR
jgi:flagellar biosynthetic protein FliR